jgi:hypothetical protein
MKTKRAKKQTPARQRIPLRFELPYACSVVVCGSFNNWDESGIGCDRDSQGIWFVELDLPPGRHEYRLIVDGEWRDVPGTLETIENPYGSRNAVLLVSAPT